MNLREELGVEFEEVNYIQSPPDAETLRAIIGRPKDRVRALLS